MKILITGCNGFLGYNLSKYFFSHKAKIIGIDLSDKAFVKSLSYFKCDLTERKSILQICKKTKPKIIINTVAIADVDRCEMEKKMAYDINVQTAQNIGFAASVCSARLIHISTDQLFSGSSSFYKEESVPSPVNAYGLTKLEAERQCLLKNTNTVVVRTNFYGWSPPEHKLTFAEWLYLSLRKHQPITLFRDLYFTPIEVTYLAEALEEVFYSGYKGILNISGTERCSKYAFGKALAKVFGLDDSRLNASLLKRDSFIVKRQPDLSLSTKKFRRLFKTKLPDILVGLRRFQHNMQVKQSLVLHKTK